MSGLEEGEGEGEGEGSKTSVLPLVFGGYFVAEEVDVDVDIFASARGWLFGEK